MKMKEEQFRLIQAQIKRLMGQGGFYSKNLRESTGFDTKPRRF